MSEPFHIPELGEVLGQLYGIEEIDGDCLALIGKIPTALPAELMPKLKSLVGRRIGILRLDGYHVRRLES